MLKVNPPEYKHCPFCGAKLSTKTGENKARKYCKKDNWTYYPHVMGSVAAIIQDKRKVLMVKRKRDPYKDTWMFPAGFIDFGEHPEETLQREVKEEVGLNVVSYKFFRLEQSTDDPRAPGHFIFEYIVKAEGKIINQDLNENSDIKWFNLSEKPRIGWQQHKDIFRILKEQNL